MNEKTVKQVKGDILIVDDTLPNLRLLSNMLSEQGYKVRAASNGKTALTAVSLAPPDLVLLDINMPEMSGYEVCEKLKADEATRYIPVIFISAKDEMLDKVKAFSVGGVDYMTKPLQVEEVLMRVKTHLTVHQLQKQLKAQNEELDAFAHTVAHDLKSPLNDIVSFADILAETCVDQLDERSVEHFRIIRDSAERMGGIIDALLLLARVSKQRVKMETLDMAEIVGYACQRLESMKEKYQGNIILPESWPAAHGYAPWVEEIWVNYMSNAFKYGGRPPKIELGATSEHDKIQFWVKDNGEGVRKEDHDNLFVPFSRLNSHESGHGLGLSIVRRVAERLGGEVGIDSTLGQGSTFYFTLPKAQ